MENTGKRDRARSQRAAPPSARSVAIRVLERVAERGAYASRALDAELGRAQLPERDAALATEIVYGALRVLPEIDRAYGAYLQRDATALDGVEKFACAEFMFARVLCAAGILSPLLARPEFFFC